MRTRDRLRHATSSTCARVTALAAAAWLGSSCGDSEGPPRIRPERAYVLPGATVQYEVVGGNETYTWAVKYDRSSGAVIDSTGLYTAGAQENNCDVVQASLSDGSSLTATALVTLTPIDPLVVDRDYLYVVTGGTHQFTVTGGSGVYFWTMPSSESGGVLEDTGMYRAGPHTGTDVVQVADSAGQATQATVVVSQDVRRPDTCTGCCGCGGPSGAASLLVLLLVPFVRRAPGPARDRALRRHARRPVPGGSR